jgi:hypothetical protein
MGLFKFFKKKNKKQELDDIIRQYKQVVNEHKSDIVFCDTTSPEYDKIFHSLINSSFFFYPKKSANANEIEFFVTPDEKFADENSQRGQVAICVFEWLQLTYSKNSNLYSQILSLFVEEEKMSIEEHLNYIQSIIKNDSLTQIIRDTKVLKAISERLRAYNKIIDRFSNSLMHLFAEHENEIIEQCISGINDFYLPTEKITTINNLTANDIESIFVRDVLGGKNLLEEGSSKEQITEKVTIEKIYDSFLSVISDTIERIDDKIHTSNKMALQIWFSYAPLEHFKLLFLPNKNNQVLISMLEKAEINAGEKCAYMTQGFMLFYFEQILRNSEEYRNQIIISPTDIDNICNIVFGKDSLTMYYLNYFRRTFDRQKIDPRDEPIIYIYRVTELFIPDNNRKKMAIEEWDNDMVGKINFTNGFTNFIITQKENSIKMIGSTDNLEVSKINLCIDVANDYLQKRDYEINDYSIDDCYDLVSLWEEKGLPKFFHWSGPGGGGCSGFNETERIKCIVEWYKILTNKEITEEMQQRYLGRLSGGMYEKEMSVELVKDFNFNLSEIATQKISNQDDYNLIDTFFSETSEYTKFLTSPKSLSIANDEGTCMATLSKNGNYFIYRLDWAKDGKNIGDYVIPFSATQENIEKFNQGCKIMAERLALYIKTNNAKVVPINPPAFGDLTYTEKKKTETKPIDTKGSNTNLSKFVDENGEPMVLKHNCPPDRVGKEMTKEELHKFAVELLSDLYKNAGMTMINVNRNYHREYPNIVMQSRNEKSYYVIIETVCFPQKAEFLYSADFTEMKQYAKEFNATPVFAGMSFMNANREPNKLICGDNYFVAFKGLEAI